MNKEINKLKMAQILADAMIKEIKEKNLIRDVIEFGDDIEILFKNIQTLLGFKLGQIVLEYIETDKNAQAEISAMEEVLKNLFGG
jgi:ABC-type methionine transport system ATPase subunit